MNSNPPDVSAKSRRGGARPGAGRPRKGRVAGSALAPIDIASALALPSPTVIETEAQAHAADAIRSLVTVMTQGQSDAARVSAAIRLLDRGYGKPATEAAVDNALPLFARAMPSPARNLETARVVREEARRHARIAILTLHRIASASTSEAARVSAAAALLDRGVGAVAVANLGALTPAPAQPVATPESDDPIAALLN